MEFPTTAMTENAQHGLLQVRTIREEIKNLWVEVENSNDIGFLIEIVQQYSGYLTYLQEEEQSILPFITSSKTHIEICSEIVKVEEAREALRLNNKEGIPMGKADKLAAIATRKLREELTLARKARNEYEDLYTDLRGFRTVVEGQKMTIHQKIKNLMEEYKHSPHRVER
jgi:hypothetical protein